MSEKRTLQQFYKKYSIKADHAGALFDSIVARAAHAQDLTAQQAKQAMVLLMSGSLSEVQIAGFLSAMHSKGEKVGEIAAFAEIMRAFAPTIFASHPSKIRIIDSCGTGGGTVQTFNISTVATFVLAAAGLHVAKHGNRAITSLAGSADVLSELGVTLDLPPRRVGACVKKVGIGFLFAPHFHRSTRFVQPVRKQLPHKTFFNILGPLTNPARPPYQVVGVYAPELTKTVAEALKKLGTRRAMVVHGLSDTKGECLDEISLLGPTTVTELKGGALRTYTFDPRKYGYRYCKKSDIAGGSAQENARILKNILTGKDKGPRRDVVVLNAAAGLIVGGKARTFASAISLAHEVINNGTAFDKVQKLIRFT
ncbi:MAG: anthranilate phosphoribosyltransferase [Candidatus Omnitrophica bacterium]|nr:anthranilate phosphoribosyltransferase [Candidatus Omnitrophota bacterium]